MGKRRNSLIILAIVIALLGVSIWVIVTKPPVLGLDLEGGTELIYQGRPTPQVPDVTPEDIDRAIEIIRQRVDSLGVSEPEINRVGQDQIQVDLPNVSNARRATDQIGTTAQLSLYDFEPNVIPPDPNVQNPEDRPYTRLIDAVEAAAKQPEVSIEQCQKQGCTTSGDTYYLFDKNSLQPIGSPSEVKADLYENLPAGTTKADTKVVAVPRGTIVVEDRPDDDPATEDVDESETQPSKFYVLHDKPALNGDQITDPKPGTDQFNQPTVDFNFTDSGREAFATVTAAIAQRGADECAQANGGAPCVGISSNDASGFSGSFAIILDGELVSNPIINFVDNPNGIDGRTGAQISGVTAQEAQDLAEVLKIGALPIKLALISQSTVSATLGQQALDQGLKAGLVGLALVLMFLIFYYRFLGVIAALGLIVYAIYYFAMIKALPITVTLPGIAGLILTIGVAADSNIVIFERIKEEVRAGRSMLSAISEGYRKGIATIIDANVITLLTAFILFGLATAGVKGFAFTLGIGTIVSLFTAVLFTQAVLGLLARSPILRSPSFLGASGEGRQWKFDFTRASKYFFSLSGVILAIGAIAFATKQLNLGIDFESGTRIQAALAEPATVDEVRERALGRRCQQRRGGEDPGGREPGLRRERDPDRGRDPTRSGAGSAAATRGPVRTRERSELRLPGRRPDLRQTGGQQGADRDHLQPPGDLGLRRDPVRGQVRGPGADRPRPRHPDHRRHLRPGRPGGDERDGRRLPDHPWLLDVRHDHRLRPGARERATDAPRGVLADRQPLDERGFDPVADHRPVDRVPDRRPAGLRR